MNVNRKSGHIFYSFHKRREGFALPVKKYEFDNLGITQIDIILTEVTKDCIAKYFLFFE